MNLIDEYINFAENDLLNCFQPLVIENLYVYAQRCDKFKRSPMAGFWFDRFIELVNENICNCESCNNLKDFTEHLQKKDFL